MSFGSEPTEQFLNGRITPTIFLLVIIMCVMAGGGFPAMTYMFSQRSTWIVWGVMVVSILLLGPRLSLHRLVLPAMPLMVWLLIYVIWGTLSASYPIFEFGRKLVLRFLCFIAVMAVMTSHPRRLSFFAGSMQWVLVANLAITAWLISHPELLKNPFFTRMDTTLDSDRFAGLWGDANVAGLATLFILVLSYWARPWIAWIGRVAGAWIIYLTASRTAFWIAVALSVLYLLFAADRTSRLRAMMLLLALSLGVAAYLNFSGAGGSVLVKENPTISRVLDVSESKTREKGGGSRLDLANEWLGIAMRGPWYGHGLYSFQGDNSDATQIKRGFPDQGTHNTFLAIYIDTGWVGLALFLITIGVQLIRIKRLPLAPGVHRALFALCFVFLVFSLANHQMVSDYLGWMGFSLIFLLPESFAGQEPLAR